MSERVLTAYINGVVFQEIKIDIELRNGHSGFKINGIAASAERKLRNKLFAVLRSLGLKLPSNVLIHLESGTQINKTELLLLPILAAFLVKLKKVKATQLQDVLICGDINFSGKVLGSNHLFALVMWAKECGFKRFILPAESKKTLSLIEDIEVLFLDDIQTLLRAEVISFSKQSASQEYFQNKICKLSSQQSLTACSLIGQVHAIRAAEVAAAGGHHLLLLGAPGIGKTSILNYFTEILPYLTYEEFLESMALNCMNKGNSYEIEQGRRPIQRVPSSAKVLELTGVKSKSYGDFDLATNGCLFIDELAERSKAVLDSLKEALDFFNSNPVAGGKPRRFQLIAASNLCSCGGYGAERGLCVCSTSSIQRYQQRISQSLFDRIDLQVLLKPLNINEIIAVDKTSQVVEPNKLQKIQMVREQKVAQNKERSQLETSSYETQLSPRVKEFLIKIATKRSLSVRKYQILISVAQTLSLLDAVSNVSLDHIAEASLLTLGTAI